MVRPTWPLGLLSLACFAVHGGGHVLRGTAHDVLWACTMANLLIGLGLLLPHRLAALRLPAVGVLWLSVGNFTWAIDLYLGGEFFASSLLTHWDGLGLGLWGLYRLGYPRPAWLLATLGMVLLQGASRLVTPPSANVNVAHHVYGFYQGVYGSYLAFWLSSFVQTALAYFVIDLGLARLYARLAGRSLAGRPAETAGAAPPSPPPI